MNAQSYAAGHLMARTRGRSRCHVASPRFHRTWVAYVDRRYGGRVDYQYRSHAAPERTVDA